MASVEQNSDVKQFGPTTRGELFTRENVLLICDLLKAQYRPMFGKGAYTYFIHNELLIMHLYNTYDGDVESPVQSGLLINLIRAYTKPISYSVEMNKVTKLLLNPQDSQVSFIREDNKCGLNQKLIMDKYCRLSVALD